MKYDGVLWPVLPPTTTFQDTYLVCIVGIVELKISENKYLLCIVGIVELKIRKNTYYLVCIVGSVELKISTCITMGCYGLCRSTLGAKLLFAPTFFPASSALYVHVYVMYVSM